MSATDVVSLMDVLTPWFGGRSWDHWRTVLRAAFGLSMQRAERKFFHTVAGERKPPTKRVRELWIVAGRRAGKDSIASLIATHAAVMFDPKGKLRPGERAAVLCLACDRDQARIVLRYIRSYFSDIEQFASMVRRETKDGLELDNGVDIVVATNSYRSVRGRPILLAIFDECAFYRDERSASPDEELYRAITPAMATMPGAMLVGISSPYRKAGVLYRKFRESFGNDGDILVVNAESRTLNPTLDKAIIDRALEDDPAAASAEWLGQFRSDIETFVAREVIDAAIVPGRHELPPIGGVRYIAFVDPSGGSSDSMTLAIAHRDKNGRAVLDAVRERRPPFSPEAVVAEFSGLLKHTYRITKVVGDRYAGEWPRERFRVHGVEYEIAEQPKSDIYRDVLPLLNSGQAELLDHPRMASQLCGLERLTSRSGKDSISHAPGAHDDVANAAAGVLVLAAAHRKAQMIIPDGLADRLRAATLRRPSVGSEIKCFF
jgi:hypothetical protein